METARGRDTLFSNCAEGRPGCELASVLEGTATGSGTQVTTCLLAKSGPLETQGVVALALTRDSTDGTFALHSMRQTQFGACNRVPFKAILRGQTPAAASRADTASAMADRVLSQLQAAGGEATDSDFYEDVGALLEIARESRMGCHLEAGVARYREDGLVDAITPRGTVVLKGVLERLLEAQQGWPGRTPVGLSSQSLPVSPVSR
jgi:hypothetical protein